MRTIVNPESHMHALLLMALSSVAWSLGGFFIRVIALPSETVVFWRAIFAGAFLLGLSASDIPAAFAAIRKNPWGGLVIIFGTAAATFLFVMATDATSVAHVALIYATLPVLVTLLASAAIGETVALRAVLAGLAILVGVAVLVGDRNQISTWRGDALAGAMTLTMAIVTVAARKQDSRGLFPYYGLANALLIVILPVSCRLVLDPPVIKLLGLAAFGILQAGLGLWFAALAAPRLPAVEAALITTIEAPLGPLWVWLLLGETPTYRSLAGGGIIVGAVLTYLASSRAFRLPKVGNS